MSPADSQDSAATVVPGASSAARRKYGRLSRFLAVNRAGRLAAAKPRIGLQQCLARARRAGGHVLEQRQRPGRVVALQRPRAGQPSLQVCAA
jgi:hypothetical protein